MIELSVENLHLTYGDNPVLKGVSMTLGRGEVVSLLGPSGSGKTTLLRAVAGLEKPTSGRIAIGNRTVYDGTPRSEIPAEERNLGLVFQSYALWPHKTVFDNVAYPLKLRKVAHDQNEAMAISDRILLLNNGVIEQQGTPQEMYGSPATLFAAEFMGSNNRLHGKVMALENGRARIEGASWSLWGRAGEGVSVGEPATAVIRVERLRLDGAAQDNSLQLPLLTSMYLGDRWEYLFRTEGDDFPLRAYGTALRDAEHCHLTLPAEDVWIFPQQRTLCWRHSR